MISLFIIIITLINPYSTQSISGSTSKCGGSGPSPVGCGCGGSGSLVGCGKATVLRGQSHIGIPAACFNRVDPGPCAQDLIRIYYDHKTYTCKAFSYSGCGGNANRFVSIKNCYKLCHPYYRQRFISLHTDSGGDPNPKAATNPPEEKSEPPSSSASPPDDQPIAPNVETTPESPSSEPSSPSTSEETTTELTTTTTTTEATTTLSTTTEDKGVLYFSSLQGDKIEVKPQIQVVHEYDQFVPPPPGMGPHMRSMAGQAPAPPQSQHGYLENIQHEAYEPKGGYIKTAQGYVPSAQSEQKIVFT